jgi:hypothetical protein
MEAEVDRWISDELPLKESALWDGLRMVGRERDSLMEYAQRVRGPHFTLSVPLSISE